ncbi:MAG TPA: PfkB family carbohydrate kinase [Anaeromyxobacter sp.]|nr:PfkB family carbohydrate kinase [Anaeromyxobacter sp.]
MRAASVLVCGHVTLDVVGAGRVPGGSAWYAARALAALGVRPLLFTAAGPDFPREALAGVEAEVLPSEATTVFANAYAPDGARSQRVLHAAAPLDPRRLPPAWRGADALLLAPVLGEIDVPAFVTAAGARLAALGVQGLVREVGPDGAVAPRRWDPDPAALAGVGAAVLGEDDVRGQGDLVARLAAVVPVVVLTQGVRGCEVLARGRTSRVGVYPTREVDPTGAGDVFAAALLLALARGDDPLDAARLGAAAASVVVEARGGDALDRVGEAFARTRGVSPA